MPEDRHTPLLVLSNRLPFTLARGACGLEWRPSTGGVISSLDPILRRHGGTWIGWPGLTPAGDEALPLDRDLGYHVVPLALSRAEIDGYYDGFANRTLWPLFHSMPERARFDAPDWQSYEQVNRRFAESALANVGGETPIWVNDYHLMLAPRVIRERAPGQRVFFFLHIPFPPEDVFRRCPWHHELIQGLLGCDLIGFQIRRYAEHFLDCAASLAGAQIDRDAMSVRYAGRTIGVGAFPIGADFSQFDSWAREHRPPRSGERVVLGVDRLDYTKGLAERIQLFARLLERYPEHRGQVILVQLASPSRPHLPEYQALKSAIEALVASVNRKFGTSSWLPVHYRYELLPQRELAELYRRADVALVTPLADGMNLVAKEYVSSRFDLGGVLILSRCAGAAETMAEALIVDPLDLEAGAAALHRALVMDESERRARMAALRDRERRDDARAWISGLLEAAGCRPPALLADAGRG